MWPLLPSTPSPAIYKILDELKIITSTLARLEDDNGASSTLNDPKNEGVQVIKQLYSYLLTNCVDYPADLIDSISDLGSSSSHDCGGRSGDQWREVHVQSRELIVLTVRQTASSCMSAAFSNLNDETELVESPALGRRLTSSRSAHRALEGAEGRARTCRVVSSSSPRDACESDPPQGRARAPSDKHDGSEGENKLTAVQSS